jgi:portal protein
MKKLIVMTSDGVKSIPLSQFPAEAWTSVIEAVGSGTRTTAAYKKVPWLYRGVNARADAIANMPRSWEVNGKEVEVHDLPFELDVNTFYNEIEGDLTLFGAAYVWTDWPKPLATRRIARLIPSSIKPKYTREAGLVGFERTVGSNKVELSLQEVAPIWLPNREKEVGPGTPPGQAALRAAGALDFIDTYVEKFFEQGTVSPVIIGLDDTAEDQDVERIENWFKRKLTGIANAFGAVAVRSSVTPHKLAQNELDKLALKDLNDQKREDISTALGVPQTMLFSNAANYATANQDAFNWYELTINPESVRIDQALDARLWRGLGIRVRSRPERLEMYQEREAEKASKMTTFYDRAIVTKNEVRKQAGWDPVAGGDEFIDVSTPAASASTDAVVEGKQWMRKAVNRLKAGKSLDFPFTTIAISEEVGNIIRSALKPCKTVDEIKQVFSIIISPVFANDIVSQIVAQEEI